MLPLRTPAAAVLLTASLLSAGLAMPAPAKPLSPLAMSCQGCHQADVNAATMPALDRYPAAQIAASLKAARDMPEPGSIMARFAEFLSDAEIEALTAELGMTESR